MDFFPRASAELELSFKQHTHRAYPTDMQLKSILLVLSTSLLAHALPQVVKVPPSPQCGGKSWTGPKTCSRPDYVCFRFNDNYSECIHWTRVTQWTPKQTDVDN
ncbi:hypothetical protein FA15DRAFT_510679 [Coprinopsis marcescibilis]|uniref:CBM1 domain-containing protein n=1 Tax=Coprinopsis marcescibilis TaxID=230819 RepID=A0A5C3KQ12_COPMA|nr:hypothetical protein FA15DRAFT_510679 [Coprinopsis marcescibilis]